MRGFVGNNGNQYGMSATHPTRVGFEDPTAEVALNRVIIFVLSFISFTITSAIFGLINGVLILSMAGLAFIAHSRKTAKSSKSFDINSTNREYERLNVKEYDEISEIEDLNEEKEDKEEHEGLSSKTTYDISTEYTLFNL